MAVRNVTTSVVIAGQEIPCLSWKVVLSSNATIATLNAETSVSLLSAYGIDLLNDISATDGAEVDVYAGYDGGSSHIFGGVLDTFDPDFTADKVKIEGRDHGAVLADSKNVVSKISYKNQTIGQIVQQIAQQNGLTANVTDPGVKAGPVIWDENNYTPHPQPWWSILQYLAEQVGYEVYVTPDKALYFGPEQSSGSFEFSWGAPPGSGAQYPLKELRGSYSPRNNANFVVKVISYHPQYAQHVSSSATPSSRVLRGRRRNQKTEIVGSSVGNTGRISRGGSGSTSSKKPVYTYRLDGLTPDQADQKAQSIADDIAKREVIIEGKLEGLPGLKIHSAISLQEQTLPLLAFDGLDYSVSEVTHTFSMPQTGQHNEGGYMTEFKAMASLGA